MTDGTYCMSDGRNIFFPYQSWLHIPKTFLFIQWMMFSLVSNQVCLIAVYHGEITPLANFTHNFSFCWCVWNKNQVTLAICLSPSWHKVRNYTHRRKWAFPYQSWLYLNTSCLLSMNWMQFLMHNACWPVQHLEQLIVFMTESHIHVKQNGPNILARVPLTLVCMFVCLSIHIQYGVCVCVSGDDLSFCVLLLSAHSFASVPLCAYVTEAQ